MTTTVNPALDQRYFHAFAALVPSSRTLMDFWSALPAVRQKPAAAESDHPVQLRVLRSTVFYGRGDTQPFQAPKDDQYSYDVFGIEGDLPQLGHTLVLGSPFAALGREMTRQLHERGTFEGAEFYQLNLNTLVEHIRQTSSETLAIPQVKIRIDDDPGLTGLAISGKNALFSDIYEAAIGHGGSASVIERCIVRYDGADQGSLSVHCDNQGNFKLWVRSGFSNLRSVLPFLVSLLSTGAVTKDATPPLRRSILTQDEEG